MVKRLKRAARRAPRVVRRVAFEVKFKRRDDLHDEAMDRCRQFFIGLQQTGRDWLSLGTTKTGLVYWLKGNPPQGHERYGSDCKQAFRSLLVAECPQMAPIGSCERGRAVPLCPGRSDVDLFRDGESVIDLNAEIAHRALDLLVAQQKLDRPQIASATIYECRFGSAQ